jgi:formate-dependent nitrite reductase membrane component NrfD
MPILNKPVWEAPDIAGYFFLGGLAGGSAVISAAAALTGRKKLARVSRVAAAAAGQVSLVALVHDLGRRRRFLNMLRVLKVTSPMSVGSWILAGFVPAATVAAVSDLAGVLAPVGAAGTAAAATLGPAVTTYTAALVSNTAVPAWHDGHRWMPFVFASSALSSAAGMGLAGAPVVETAPLRPIAVGSGLAELVLSKVMEKRMGLAGEAFHEEKPKRYMHAAEALTTAGVVLAAVGRRRLPLVAAGVALLAGSCAERFAIFEAGIASAEDPKYTVVPQRERMARRPS